jgi:hypothetical protein
LRRPSPAGSSPPYLVIFCNDSKKLYRANPDNESFVRYKKYVYPLVRKVVHGCVAMDGHEDVCCHRFLLLWSLLSFMH